MTHTPEASCGCVALRPTTESDLDAVLALERDPQSAPFVRQWPRDRHRMAIADAHLGHLAIVLRPQGALVGFVILVGLGDEERCLELKRIVVGPKGRGYGRAALRCVKQLAFEQLAAHRLSLEVITHNTRAFALYRSEGFVVEGTHRECIRRAERFDSAIAMSILRHEYTPVSGGC
jgi:RimJ/RimL family protein N-acetyltransferase